MLKSVKEARFLKPFGVTGFVPKVAKASSFLASDDSSFVTGIELFVGGQSADLATRPKYYGL
jgi:hypothetical protein